MGKWHDFISLYDSDNTQRQYRAGIKTFLKVVYESDFESLEQTTERYFSEERDYKKDVTEFFKTIRHRPAQVVRSRVSTVKVFLEMCDVDLPERFWKMLRRKIRGVRAVSQERVPNNEELRQIISHMRIKGKAFFLFLASSGIRIGNKNKEALALELDDVYLEENPVRVNVRAEIAKNGDRRTTFISREAVEALREWLKVKDEWIEQAVVKSTLQPKIVDEHTKKRIFPFSHSTPRKVWKRALDKAHLNEVDKRTRIQLRHIHTLRKFFRTRMGEAIPKDIVEELIGHRNIYRKHSDNELAEWYAKGESTITVFGTSSAELAKLEKDMEESKQTIQKDKDDLLQRYLKVTKRLDDVLGVLKKHEEQLTQQEKTLAFVNNISYLNVGLKEKLEQIDSMAKILGKHEKSLKLLKKAFPFLDAKSK